MQADALLPPPLSPHALLEAELLRRIERNPRYSLRALAKNLGFSHTALSLVISGKRGVSKKLAMAMADTFELAPEARASLLASAAKLRGKAAAAAPTAYRKLDLDHFELIAAWYHYAILSLLELASARFEAKWIAARLSIQESQAALAMARLVRLGLVAPDAAGRMRQAGAPLKIENAVSTPATRLYQRDLLDRAKAALEAEPAAARDLSSMTFAMDERHVALARERIRTFRRKLMKELEELGPPTRVYHLCVQLYPVSKP